MREIFEEICKGEALLFCGAGFSYGAKLSEEEEVSGVTGFVNKLKVELGMQNEKEEEGDLKYYSDEYTQEFGEAKLIEVLKESFYVEKISESQEIIGKFPWRRIYTTNYDNVLEIATKKETITLSREPNEIVNLSNCIIHLNGSILNLTPDKINNELKLTTTSYLSESFINSTWHQIFLSDIRSCKKIIFIGFSLEHDLDLARAINQDEVKNKVFFINKIETLKQRKKLSKFGTVLDYDSEKFSEELKKFKETFKTPLGYEKPIYTFKKYKYIINQHEVVNDRNIFDLLLYGKFNLNVYLNNMGTNQYLFERNYEENIYEDIVQKNKNIIVIHSDLGNGKRIFIEKIKFKLKDFAMIYSFDDVDGDYYQDLEIIFSDNKQKKILIFESYNKYLDVLKKIGSFNLSNTFFIFTARSYVHDLVLRELEKLNYFKVERYGEYSLNSLSAKELNGIVDYLNNKNMWGKQISLDSKEKIKLLEKKCNKKISLMLLYLFESENIMQKLNYTLQKINKDKILEKILILSLINKMLNLGLNTTDLKSILNLDSNFSILIKKEEAVEILQYSDNEIGLKSSVLAEYLLKKINKDKIIDMLILLIKKSDLIKTPKFEEIKFALISFSNFQILVKDYNSNSITRYYEEIQNLNYCKKNIYFWIQYTNAVISLREFDKAKVYLENALSYSETKERPHYQTCKARYLLEKQLNDKSKENAFNIFLEANELLYNNKNEESRWHFPFKYVSLYKEYYKVFFTDFNKDEQIHFLLLVKKMAEKIEAYIQKRNKEKLEKFKKIEVIKKDLENILKYQK
ncbi:MAG: SIR2 family protein [Bacilli bacterium]